MPLDDHEQRILAEIERQFYEEDPALAHAVRNIDRSGRFGVRVPLIGLIAGMVIVIVSFTSQLWVAVAGFALMVLSATALVHGIRTRGGLRKDEDRRSWRELFRLPRRFRRG
jgi:type IV secretory pathway TrbD component